jgi:hypothetical protein
MKQTKNYAGHRRPTAHARARYRCFLPDLAGLAGLRRVGPMPDTIYFSIDVSSSPDAVLRYMAK